MTTVPTPLERILFHVARYVAENATSVHDDDHGSGMDDDHTIDVHAADSHGDDHGGGHSEFGVHITYNDLYNSIVFLTAIYVAGVISAQVLKMPNLVGEVFAGIILGPPLLDFVPNPEAWVLLGEIGLIILVLEAGIDIDVSTLKLIGTRGFLIAVIGSILPIALGMFIAWAIDAGDTKAIIAAGAVFGPTSLGIALNILRGGGILNTPVGQLIISAAVIDDMIALIVLSQLESLVGEITVAGILIPVVSATLYLVVGGYIAIWVAPPLLEKYITGKAGPENKDKMEMAIMFGLVLALMPATYYSKASYLMGAFVAGLTFCTSHELHTLFVRQFKRLLQWLMRVFFAASIGFQVPIKDFGNVTVIWQGLVFTLALLGKLAVGFLVPNFTQSKSFTNQHLRDCLITGFSMAAEGEFAFVIAVYSVDNELISKDLYASVVLAVLISTVIPPFALRFTISYYNKKAEEAVQQAVKEEMNRNHDLESTVDEPDRAHKLEEGIRNKSAVFLCIQTQSSASWGLMHRLMATMARLGMEVIDHRAWSPRGVNTTLVNEIYVKDTLEVSKGASKEELEKRIAEITQELMDTINQPEVAKVKVQRWYPGVVEEYTEEVDENQRVQRRQSLNVEQRVLEAATAELERKQAAQTTATHEKSVAEILREMGKDVGPDTSPSAAAPAAAADGTADPPKKARRRRQKMRSTPVIGGGLFGEGADKDDEAGGADQRGKFTKASALPSAKTLLESFKGTGHAAEITIDGEVYKIRVNEATLKSLRQGYSGEMLDSRGISVSGGLTIQQDEATVVNRLQGFVRNAQLGQIKEEVADASETSGDDHKDKTAASEKEGAVSASD
ncbi:Cation/H(+) antiporter [Seminavis robusta]|uniref:Cation/H(+) antiporter n=1 Tax=Seminavis robusta TaxID=568900 RepID=A0A9N8DGC8_9STRA|nr:Cation/H(+) antiporter [Seminavis robusta]|eukprot:Sro128_g061410.1 Cation/H(+) antiporter (845) ;mRNA; f:104915-108170